MSKNESKQTTSCYLINLHPRGGNSKKPLEVNFLQAFGLELECSPAAALSSLFLLPLHAYNNRTLRQILIQAQDALDKKKKAVLSK